MLQLKNIVKTYVTGDTEHDALKGINITFRKNEFVSILGQSGSGKTTMLNIIGGLDRYTSGDLVISGVSTKEYDDHDWDFYRNNSIGFVFQSYNLIPHQTVLANVEMALTLAGVSKKERKEKAISVLEKVGLKEHIYKKPNQMSGGQMQRVAIARALINNPDILLADEPTGALDSETSVQIMELLKEIAKDKLVIMVTHNPELAEKYSTRIVRLLDGEIISDTKSYNENEEEQKSLNVRKISMSFMTALSLSFNNLRTKKGRTLLTAFAGSIGIIGIALVLALSAGLNDYIDTIQKDTMSSYPITISSESVDMTDVMGKRKEMVESIRDGSTAVSTNKTGIYAQFSESESSDILSSSLKENNLSAFKKYLDNPESEIRQYISENGIEYSYDLDFSVYSYASDGTLVSSSAQVNEDTTAGGLLSSGVLGSQSAIASRFQSITSMLGGGTVSSAENFSLLMKSATSNEVNEAIVESYDVLYGSWPQNYDDVVLVLNSDNSISPDVLYQLGFITKEQYDENSKKVQNGENATLYFDYSCVDNHTFYLVCASDHYVKNENSTFTYIDDSVENEDELLKNAIKLRISGIIRPKDQAENATVTTAIAYTSKLSDYIINHTDNSAVVKAQEENASVNVLNGTPFEVPDENKKIEETKEYLSNLENSEKSSVYTLIMYYQTTKNSSDSESVDVSKMSDSEKAAAFDEWIEKADDEVLLSLFEGVSSSTGATSSSSIFSGEISEKISNSFIGKIFSKLKCDTNSSCIFTSNTSSSIISSAADSAKLSMIKEYISNLDEAQKAQFYTMIVNYNLDTADAETINSLTSLMGSVSLGGMSGTLSSNLDTTAAMLDSWLQNNPDSEILIKLYDEYIGYSTYEDNMEKFGKVSYDKPTSISIYTESFDNKEAVDMCIANYNESVEEDMKITYTDYVSLLSSSITTIIDTISYAIIFFVGISLVVSCVMIGIITHISVMERTKEIGILRALGASKQNISQVFNAETFIIGCCAGLIGVLVSSFLTIPINIIIEKVSGFDGLSARLPFSSSVVLILISIVITIIGGLLPAKKAANKDPVIALRSE